MQNKPDNYSESIANFEARKKDHIDLSLDERTQALDSSDFSHLELIHDSLPNISFQEIDLSTTSLGIKVETPFYVAAMTAGHKEAEGINYRLAEACSETGWLMMVGSQRRELFDSNEKNAWLHITNRFPQTKLVGNLGLSQIAFVETEKILELVESTKCIALAIHCNPLQEVMQPEGTTDFTGSLERLAELANVLPVPVVLKETGSGFSKNSLEKVKTMNLAAVDISGLGGTHWGRIEGFRAEENSYLREAAELYKSWGVPTLASANNALELGFKEVWGSGGVRNGLHAAKLLSLGARRVGMAKPLLRPAMQSTVAVTQFMKNIEFQLRVGLFCTGSKNLSELKGKYQWKNN